MLKRLLLVVILGLSASVWAAAGPGVPMDRSTGWQCSQTDSQTPPSGQATPLDCQASWFRQVTGQYTQCAGNPPGLVDMIYTENTGALNYQYGSGSSPTGANLDDVPWCSGYSTWNRGTLGSAGTIASLTATQPNCPLTSFWSGTNPGFCKCSRGKWDGNQCSSKTAGTGLSAPTITYGSGSGATYSTNLASWQQVMPYVTLDGQTTFTSLGSTSGGITFGLPVIDSNATPVGEGVGTVDGTTWNIVVNSSGTFQFVSSSNGAPLQVSNLTNSSTLTYHISYNPSSIPKVTLTWVPVLYSGASSSGFTYTQQIGHYSVSNGWVNADFSIALSAKPSGSGRLTIQGLPIPDTGTCGGGGYTTGKVGWAGNGTGYIGYEVCNSVIYIENYSAGVTQSDMYSTDIVGNGTYIYGEVSYPTAH